MICAITLFLMAHRWRKPVCAAIKRCLRKSDGGGSTATTLFLMEHRWRRWRGVRPRTGQGGNAPAKLRTATSQFDKCLIPF